MKDVDIDKILLSNQVFSSEKNYKYFVSYKDDYKIKPLYILREHVNNFPGDMRLSFLIEDDKLLDKYKKIWDKVSNSTKKEFYIEIA